MGVGDPVGRVIRSAVDYVNVLDKRAGHPTEPATHPIKKFQNRISLPKRIQFSNTKD
jgi:hypothetical protein